jgi:hypothetical protein
VLIYDLGNRQWDIPQLRELLEDILPQNTNFNDFEVEHHFETIGPKIMHLNARRIYTEENQTQLILLAIEDVTEREDYKRNLEDIVEKRTAELRIAKEDALNSKHLAENALAEIKQPTNSKPREPICRKRSSWNSTMKTSSAEATKSNMCFTRSSKSPPRIPMSWYWGKPEPAKNWWHAPFTA